MGTKKRARIINAERRQFPRVAISVPLVLTGAKGQTVNALMHNVSPGGMQVRLGTEAAAALLPKRDEIGNSGVVSVLARFLVPLREERVAISVKCVVAHVSPVDGALAAARIAIGFRFKRFKNKKNLRRFVLFLEEQLVPIEDYEIYLHGHPLQHNKSSSKGIKKV